MKATGCSWGRADIQLHLASILIFILLGATGVSPGQFAPTNLAAIVRHAPSLNGNGRIEGSLQQLLGENLTINGGFTLTGDLLLPGTPKLRLNGKPAFDGIIAGIGSDKPAGYQVTLNGHCSIGHLRTRTTPVALPNVPPPPPPAGSRSVTINQPGQSIGDPATLRNLTLNGNVGQVPVPPGTYGKFIANGGGGFILGTAGSTQPTIYNLQSLSLNGQAQIEVLGPVIVTLANGFSANGRIGATNHPGWLRLQIASGGFTLNGGCSVHGNVAAPAGTVIINGNSLLAGAVQCDRLTVNSGGALCAGLSANNPPSAHDQNLTTAEDAALTITFTGTDPEGAALTFSLLTPPAHGTLTLDTHLTPDTSHLSPDTSHLSPDTSHLSPDTYTYTPATNYHGADSFTFKVNDGQADSAPATVSIAVTPVNDAPIAMAQILSTPEDTPLNITLTGADVDGDSMMYQVVVPPTHGTLTPDTWPPAPDTWPPAPGTLMTYLPDPDFSGTDAFTFSASDGQLSGTNIITIAVNAVDDRPVANAQQVTTDEDTPVSVTLTGSDAEGAMLIFTILSPPVHGTMTPKTWHPAPDTLIYIPATNYHGADGFTFEVTAGALTSAVAEVSLVIRPVNDAPEALAQWIVMPEDTATNLVLTGTDVEGDPLQFALIGSITNGTVTGTAPELVFSPASDFHGTNIIEFTVHDSQATSGPVAVTVLVTPMNDAPIAVAQNLSTPEDTLLNITLTGTDVDGDPLTYEIVAPPAHGTIHHPPSAIHQCTYLPHADFNGVDSFEFVADDGATSSFPATVTLTIQPVNDAPEVSIRFPVPGTEFAVGQPIPVMIEAADVDGEVVSALLFGDGLLLAEFSEPPFSFEWLSAAPGNHELVAVSTDDSGDSSVSIGLSVSVAQAETGDFTVDAGPDQLISLPGHCVLSGAITLQTVAPGSATNVLWTMLNGPGTVQFTPADALQTAARFSEAGTYLLKLGAGYGGGTRSDVVSVEVLPAVPSRLTAARSNRGTEFWLTFLDNLIPSSEYDLTTYPLVITSKVHTRGRITSGNSRWGGRVTESFEVQPGAETVVYAAGDSYYEHSDLVVSNAVHIEAEDEITVHGLDQLRYSTDGFLGLPASLLGTNYMVLTYRNSAAFYDPAAVLGGTQFAVVASEDGTTVQITPTASAGSRQAGVPFDIVLQAGETYRLAEYSQSDSDFTGTIITSDKPVAVFGGHTAALVPATIAAADNLVEQLPPVETWSRHFITVPSATRTGGDTFRFLAAAGDTRVAVNGHIVARLERGQFHECILDGPAQILSTGPILVAQFAHGSDYDGSAGDPFMMLVPPVEQFSGDCDLATPPAASSLFDPQPYTNYVSLTVPSTGAGTIELDGAPVPAEEFHPVGTSGYSAAQLAVPPGFHHLSAPVPFGACLHGWADFESYAFPGGIYSDTAAAGTRLELAQTTPCAAVGTGKVALAFVTNGRGRVIPDLEITFVVSGAHSFTATARTQANGVASLSYIGTNTGPDVIEARLADLRQAITNTWVVAKDNLPPAVSVLKTPALQFDSLIELSGEVADDGRPNGAPLNLRWRQVNGPGLVTIADETATSTTAAYPVPGTYGFELTADDTEFSSHARLAVTVVRPFIVEIEGVEPGAWFSTNASLCFQAAINLLDGPCTNVEFYDGDTRLSGGEWTSYCRDHWAPGQHAVSVVATEAHGFQARSAPLVFNVTEPPRIQVFLPEHDLTLPFGSGSTRFLVQATDPDGAVTNIAVYWDSLFWPVIVHEVAGDQMDYTGPVDLPVWGYCGTYGTHPIHFRATDDRGITTEITPISITLEPPVMNAEIVFPAESAVFMVGQPVTLIVNASVTSPARINSVEFSRWVPGYWGDWWWVPEHWEPVNQADTAAPFATQWTPTETGDFQFTARIGNDTDLCGFSSTPTRTIHVAPASVGVVLHWPTNGAQVYAGCACPIRLELHDPTRLFRRAEFFANGQSLGQTTNAWYHWVPPQTGNYTLSARAFDQQGRAFNSTNSVAVEVGPAPTPEVSIASPAAGSRLPLGTPAFVAVELNDPADSVTNLALHVDGARIADSAATQIAWTPAQPGSHTLEIVSSPCNAPSVRSVPVAVTVFAPQAPLVTILSPTNAERFASGTVPFARAQAADPDGAITNLDLTVDSAPAGGTNGATCELPLSNVTRGWHELAAHATDNDGLAGSSEVIRFFVERSEDAALPVPELLAAAASSSSEIALTWRPSAANPALGRIVAERWNPANNSWNEIGGTAATNSSYLDSNLNPETNYRYRIATLDTNGNRSAWSAEANATTRTVLPHYAVIDLTESLATTFTNRAWTRNILTNSALAHFDIRRAIPASARTFQSVLGTNAATLIRAVARFKEHWPQIQLDYDPLLLAPKSILPRSGYLTGPGGSGVTVTDATAQRFDPGDPDRPVKAFLLEHQTLFGFGPEAITNATVERNYSGAGNGARTVVWQQQIAGLPVFNARLIAHLTATGELAGLSSQFIPSPAEAADPAMVAVVQSGADLPQSGPQALITALNNVGDVLEPGDLTTENPADGISRKQAFASARGLKGEAHVELTWFPASRARVELCWQVLFTSDWRDEMYLTLVSAESGRILYRRGLTADSSDSTYRVYTGNSPSPFSPGWPAPDAAQPPPADRSLVTLSALNAVASPNGWIPDGDNETRGNNADAHLDRNDDDSPDAPRAAGNPARVFDFPLDLNADPAGYGDAATVQLFYWNNWMHDALYELGFNEAAGNFQNHNFDRGGRGGDAVQADAQDGSDLRDGLHHDNANMSTPPDGFAPRMQMFVFDGPEPDRDGSLDAEIVLHEYTHGLTSRLLGGGSGIEALQTGGMGEGWSDFYALAMLADPADDVDGVYPAGAYVAYHGFGTGFEENYYYGIRRYPYCTDTNKNPLTFADIDPWKASPHDGVPRNPLAGPFRAEQASEVHRQGEVWCQMLWDLRANLVKKHGFQQGNSLALQFVTDGLRLSPPNPNFVQARDAILLADRMWSGGANAPEIWSAFARRGLGHNAKCPESYTTVGVQESRSPAPALVAERVEVQGGNGNGMVETNEDNTLFIVVHNQGKSLAAQVVGRISTATPGVAILQDVSGYPDVPPVESRGNSALFQIRTLPEFIAGTPIDLAFVITSDQLVTTNVLRLFTGTPGTDILFDNFSAAAAPGPASAAMKDLTPWNLDRLEPLWMAENGSCLLKADQGCYVLWRMDGPALAIASDSFLAHRLTRHGVVVGSVEEPETLDELANRVRHARGAWWDFDAARPRPLTRNEYRWPRDAAPLPYAGRVYSLLDTGSAHPEFLTNVTSYPTLHDAWDLNAAGQAVGSVSVQESFALGPVQFASDGTMNWFTASERGLDAGSGTNSATQADYWAMLSTAAQFNSLDDWRWLGPLSLGNSTAIALLINDAGSVAGYGGIYTGDPDIDAFRPTHAFRAPAGGEFDGTGVKLIDLGVLPGGLHSMPRAMNRFGDLVGFSDFDVLNTGGFNWDPLNCHAVFWGSTATLPEPLPNLPPGFRAPYGYGDAFGLDDLGRIVGASLTPAGLPVGVMWQLNHSTNAPAFWEITDLNERLTDPDWHVFSAVGINNDGLILAHATNSVTGRQHAVLLIPFGLRTDADRDGEIRFDASDATTKSRPFRFWLNDDQDDLPIDETVPARSPDYADDKIKTTRDLEDFARIDIRVGAFHEAIAAGAYRIGLKWKNRTGSPAIKEWRNYSPDGSDDYVRDESVARQHLALTGPGHVQGLATEFIPAEVWRDANLGATNPVLHLLFEGAGEGSGQLVLTLNRPDGSEIAEVSSLWLALFNVKNMYQRHDASGENHWPGMAFARDPREQKTALVFVHGWRMSPDGASCFAESMFKRLWHRGYKGRFAAFRWNTHWSESFQWMPWNSGIIVDSYLSHYNDSEYRGWQAGAALKSFIESLPADYVKNMAAHSMGNIVAGSALEAGLRIDNYALLQAAVPASCYDDSESIRQTHPYRHKLWIMWDAASPDADLDADTRRLSYRGRLRNVSGNLVSFFLPDDYATVLPWEFNNDQTKPPRSDGSLAADYEYAPSRPPGQRLYRRHANYAGNTALEVVDYPLTEPYEAMAFACRAWSKAVGAEGATGGAIDGSVNLSAPTFNLPGKKNGFGDQHSGEFNGNIQQLKPFYDQLLVELDMHPLP